MVSPSTGRNIQSESTSPRSVTPNKPGGGCGQAATLSPGYIEYASGRAEVRPIARMTPTLIPEDGGELRVQSLFDHHEPGGYHRTVPGDEPIRRRSAAHARRIPGISSAGRAQRSRGAGHGDDALGNVT